MSATSPPPVSNRPTISLVCRNGNPGTGNVQVQVELSHAPEPSVPIEVDFGDHAPMRFQAPVDRNGLATIEGRGVVLEMATRLSFAKRLTITVDRASASFDIPGFDKISKPLLEICTQYG